MTIRSTVFLRTWAIVFLLGSTLALQAMEPTNRFTVATYNVWNWLSMERGEKDDAPKPEIGRDAVANLLTNASPDVLAIQEMGSTNDLADLVARLRQRGLDYPFQEWIQGGDDARHVALLSRFHIVARQSRTNDTYRLREQTLPIQRGILDVQIQVNTNYSFRALVVHLKSKREIEHLNQADMRRQEARLLRQHLNRILAADPQTNFLLMGDFNDTLESSALSEVLGDTNHPGLFVLDAKDSLGYQSTHYYRGKRLWSRIDYLIASPGMSNEYVLGSARIGNWPGWHLASDHRVVYASFLAGDRGTNLPIQATKPAPK